MTYALIALSNGQNARVIQSTEIAYAAEEACGRPYSLRPIIVPARNDGRETKLGEVARMWQSYLRLR